jgi:hypothetical protein
MICVAQMAVTYKVGPVAMAERMYKTSIADELEREALQLL